MVQLKICYSTMHGHWKTLCMKKEGIKSRKNGNLDHKSCKGLVSIIFSLKKTLKLGHSKTSEKMA